MELVDFEEEDRVRYPYFIFYDISTIPWSQKLSIDASLINMKSTHVVSISKFQSYIENIEQMERTNTLGILPSGILPYAKRFYFHNQRIRWAFKRLLYIYKYYKSNSLVFNTECLEGTAIRYNPSYPSRRILRIWDNSSKRAYLFRIMELLGIFRACILGDEIHKPKNPYTNLPFTDSQIRQIHMFFHSNMDRLLPEDKPILTYTRWISTEITYDHLDQQASRYGGLTIRRPEEPMIANLLWDGIMSVQTLEDDKQPLAMEIRDELLTQVYYEAVTNLQAVPTTKLGRYVRTTLLNGASTESPGEELRKWHNTNRKRYTIRHRPTGNHRNSE